MPSEEDSDSDVQQGATWEHQSLAQVKIKVLRGHKDAVNSCSFAFEDSKIVTASHDKTLRLWVGFFHPLTSDSFYLKKGVANFIYY